LPAFPAPRPLRRHRPLEQAVMIKTSWTREQVEELLRTENFRYQRIELPYGLHTEGRDRTATAKQIFPEDMTGKSVLDIGCSHGFFCFEAARRGATRVLGLDVEPEVVRKNRLLADCLGLNVEFGVIDIERQRLTEKFDYVLCLNVLHHLSNPLTVLDNLVDIAQERLVLEMASFGGHDARRLGLFPGFGHLLAKAPIMYIARGGTSGKRQLKRSFLTQSAVYNLLAHHRHIYARVDMMPSEHKDRYIVIAQRQKIDHLAVVAGPTSSGKSTFIDRFLKGELAEIYPRVAMDPKKREVTYLTARVKENPGRPHMGDVMFHYDMLRPYMRSARVHSRDEALDVLDSADKVTFLTMWTSPEKLLKQLGPEQTGLFKKPGKRARAIRRDYADPRRIVELYDEWFAYLDTRAGEKLVVDQSGNRMELITIKEWRDRTAQWRH
jgi:SAM-dependent methyltransferase